MWLKDGCCMNLQGLCLHTRREEEVRGKVRRKSRILVRHCIFVLEALPWLSAWISLVSFRAGGKADFLTKPHRNWARRNRDGGGLLVRQLAVSPLISDPKLLLLPRDFRTSKSQGSLIFSLLTSISDSLSPLDFCTCPDLIGTHLEWMSEIRPFRRTCSCSQSYQY